MREITSIADRHPKPCDDRMPTPAETDRREARGGRDGVAPPAEPPRIDGPSSRMGASAIGIPLVRPSRWLLAVSLAAVGCGTSESPPDARTRAEQNLRNSDPVMFARIEDDVRKVVSDATVRYWPLEYGTDELLVDYLDQVNKQIDAGAAEPSKRYLMHMEPKEEFDHIRQTIGRWSARTGKNLRDTIDGLKADIANRDPKETNFPEFHRKFAAELSEFIQLENEELRERRDRMIRANLPAALAPYRESHPAIVADFEERYADPVGSPPASSRAEAPAEPRKS